MSADNKDCPSTTSPDEGLGDSLARQSSLTDSRRSDSCDTDKAMEPIQSESDSAIGSVTDNKNVMVTNPSVDGTTEAEKPSREMRLLSAASEDGGK